MVADMSESAAEMLLATGAEDIETRNEMSAPGLAIHEVGTARMGNDPKTSVLKDSTERGPGNTVDTVVASAERRSLQPRARPTIVFIVGGLRSMPWWHSESKVSAFLRLLGSKASPGAR